MSENENDFEALRRLLALKRYEVPPPGYFDDFSGIVIGRIRAAQAARQAPLLLRLLQAFEAKPAYPVAFASALCTLLLFGIVSVEQSPGLVANPVLPGSMDNRFSVISETQQPLATVVGTNSPVDSTLFGAPQQNPSTSFQEVDFASPAN
ncbi:MAG: hypothetical protein ACREE6_04540 [Limisphaerales bacterium]